MLLGTLPMEDETSNALPRSTRRITGRDTAQTERILMRLVDTSSLDSRLYHPGTGVFARHPCIEPVSFLVVSASVARTIRRSFFVLTSHTSPNQANKARKLADFPGNVLHGTTLNMRSQLPTKHIKLDLTNVDLVSSNVKPSGFSFIFICLSGQ